MPKTKRKAYIAIVHLLKIHKNRFSGSLITLSTQKRCTSMAQTVAPSGHQCCGPVTPFIAQITSKFDMIIQVSLSLRASCLQVKFLEYFTLSGIEKTLLIMVGKCQGYIINVLPNKVWSCHFGNIQVSLSSMGVLSGT